MLQKVEMGDAYALLQYPDSQIAALDNYARWRCRLLLAVAYNRPDVAASTADSLLFLKADSLDTNDYISLCAYGGACPDGAGTLERPQPHGHQTGAAEEKQIALGTLSAFSKTFLNCGPTTVSRPEEQTFAFDLSRQFGRPWSVWL